jgi:hypothetical protein
MDIARCVNDPEPYQNSALNQKKPEAAKKPTAAAPAKPATPQVQKPLEAPRVISVHDDDADEDETIAIKTAKKSGVASQLAWSATYLAIVTASVLLSL